jgi:glycosyltransferase involved in cell wall biosynthesis
MSKPTISVIIPVYNHADYLDECIGSVLAQGIDDLELIVINDGSTDPSETLLRTWQNRYAGMNVIHKQNEGVSVARNLGLELATGEFVQFLDADDILAPGKLAFQVQEMNENPHFDLVYGPSLLFRDKQQVLGPGFSVSALEGRSDRKEILRHLVRYIPFQIGVALVRRSAISDTRFDPQLKASEDWKFMLQLGLKGLYFHECSPACPALMHRLGGDKKVQRSYFEAEMNVRAFIKAEKNVPDDLKRLSEKQRRWYSLKEYRQQGKILPFTKNLLGYLFSLPLKTRAEWKMLFGEVLFPEWYQRWKQKSTLS